MNKSGKATMRHVRALRAKRNDPKPKPQPNGQKKGKVMAENGEK